MTLNGAAKPARLRRKFALASLTLLLFGLPAHAERFYVIASSLGGDEKYSAMFAEQVEQLASAANKFSGGKSDNVIALSPDQSTSAKLIEVFNSLAKQLKADDELIVTLIGHGTYDGREYKFNVKGPDLTGESLMAQLDKIPARRQILINTTSSSGAIAELPKTDNRIVITATKSGGERNATRFAQFWIEAHEAAAADLDKNELLSLKEVYDYTQLKVADYYESRGQLATEHARLVGDTGQINLARLGAIAKVLSAAETNPEAQRLVQQRNDLEEEITQLRSQRRQMDESEYLSKLQSLLVELSITQSELDELLNEPDNSEANDRNE